jgi:hypothetical protein
MVTFQLRFLNESLYDILVSFMSKQSFRVLRYIAETFRPLGYICPCHCTVHMSAVPAVTIPP